MQWYEILFGIVAWIIGFYIWTKYKDYHSNKYHNDSWKNRRKK